MIVHDGVQYYQHQLHGVPLGIQHTVYRYSYAYQCWYIIDIQILLYTVQHQVPVHLRSHLTSSMHTVCATSGYSSEVTSPLVSMQRTRSPHTTTMPALQVILVVYSTHHDVHHSTTASSTMQHTYPVVVCPMVSTSMSMSSQVWQHAAPLPVLDISSLHYYYSTTCWSTEIYSLPVLDTR